MSRRLRSLFSGLLAVSALLAGCSTHVPELTPKGRVDVPVRIDVERVRVTAELANVVDIHLAPIATPGTEWTMVLNDARFLKPLGAIKPAPDGGFIASFFAIRPGRRPIRFLAIPPGQKVATSSQNYEVIVEIE